MQLHISTDDQRVEVRITVRRSFALARIVRFFKRWRKAPRPRTPGLHTGIYEVRDDFDDPLTADFLISDV